MIHPKWTTTDPHKRLARLILMHRLALVNVVVLLVIGTLLSFSFQIGLEHAVSGTLPALSNRIGLIGGFFLLGLSAAVLYVSVVIDREIKQGRAYLAGHR